MFGFRSDVVTKRSNREIFDEEMKELNSLLDSTLKASGVSIMDMASGLDEESGALLGKAMQSYKKICDLAAEQTGIIDRIESKVDTLEAQNEKMLKQIENLTDLVKKSAKEK